jgi:hypothetical protein
VAVLIIAARARWAWPRRPLLVGTGWRPAGLLIRGPEVLESTRRRHRRLDKTGTVTSGAMRLVDAVTALARTRPPPAARSVRWRPRPSTPSVAPSPRSRRRPAPTVGGPSLAGSASGVAEATRWPGARGCWRTGAGAAAGPGRRGRVRRASGRHRGRGGVGRRGCARSSWPTRSGRPARTRRPSPALGLSRWSPATIAPRPARWPRRWHHRSAETLPETRRRRRFQDEGRVGRWWVTA